MERNELFFPVEQRNVAHNDMRLAALLIHYCSHFNFHNTRFQFHVDTCSSSAALHLVAADLPLCSPFQIVHNVEL